ncbi:MAG: hypothetical protein ACE366_04705 [Bradymonadia bacterium]
MNVGNQVSFQAALDEHFPGSMEEEAFVRQTKPALAAFGFTPDNTIPAVGLCRDELCRTFSGLVRDVWGDPFKFSSLAGMVFLGRTGFGAFHHHSPIIGERERYLYFALPHIAIGPSGTVGECTRPGRPGKSSACGALAAFHAELTSGTLDLEPDPDDQEQGLLKAHMLKHMQWGETPDLAGLTHKAHEVILGDLERMIRLTVNPNTADYAVMTGVQIHGPEGKQYVWPGKTYAVVKGDRHELSLSPTT